MARDDITRKAANTGKSAARRVLTRRSTALSRRAVAVARGAAALATVAKPVLAARSGKRTTRTIVEPSRRARSLFSSAPSAGVVVAEGDSWFDYPWTDVLEELEDEHGFEVHDVARAGDRIEDMAYSDGQLAKFARALEKVLRDGKVPRAILLSGGGNDIAGDDFHMLLNHATAPKPGLNEALVEGIIDQRLRASYVTILEAITAVVDHYLTARVPILLHGYDYAIPDGRGFLGGWGPLPGPWLAPGFDRKGYPPRLDARTRIVGELIDRFNAMLARMVALPGLEHVRYVNLRNTLSSPGNHRDQWANELHPTPDGFARVARTFADVIEKG